MAGFCCKFLPENEAGLLRCGFSSEPPPPRTYHLQRCHHRNVLLEAVANNMWKAKLSDFGSTNLVRYATTPCKVAVLYPSPESFPQPSNLPLPNTQDRCVQLWSEVITQELPDPSMVEEVQKLWPQMHPLVTSCIQHSPEKRPIMSNILEDLDKLTTPS